ncbi:hypothetical protein L3N51_01222 [Metallosphaera sp. J1]|uniref:hypothetical protein n=1 Tax=Metallosphaera javensis (ex Hofmann et al. 2022) TaxID=99938 RepID=UPI001EE0EAE5|nr:hypothetical protein [Metallosphaera javensis (ex Hofmann et al. 2022)]MCG3108932.1 hypothetical protein [Metallosphaera javensis (ex Hofmann et al. 2022)]
MNRLVVILVILVLVFFVLASFAGTVHRFSWAYFPTEQESSEAIIVMKVSQYIAFLNVSVNLIPIFNGSSTSYVNSSVQVYLPNGSIVVLNSMRPAISFRVELPYGEGVPLGDTEGFGYGGHGLPTITISYRSNYSDPVAFYVIPNYFSYQEGLTSHLPSQGLVTAMPSGVVFYLLVNGTALVQVEGVGYA